MGLAVEGFRPVMEVQFLGFVFEVFDAIAGQIARTRFRSGGTKTAPVTIVAHLVVAYTHLNCTQTT